MPSKAPRNWLPDHVRMIALRLVALAAIIAALIYMWIDMRNGHHDNIRTGTPPGLLHHAEAVSVAPTVPKFPTASHSTVTEVAADPDSPDSDDTDAIYPQDQSEREPAASVARRFAERFASPAATATEWATSLAPDAAPALTDQYRLTDNRNLPAPSKVAAISGPLGAGSGAAAFDVDYENGDRIEERLEISENGWKVVAVIPLRSGGENG